MNSILLIDNDNTSNFNNERVILNINNSTNVMIAANGKEAISWILQGNCPELILLDIKIPNAEIFEFFRALIDNYPQQKEKVTIAVLSNSTHFEDRRNMQKLGIKHHIIKPLTEQKLRRVLNNLKIDIYS